MITVYTCATNRRDSLREDQCTDGANFVAYVDQIKDDSNVWKYLSVSDLFRSPRRNARMHKVLSHQFIPEEYSIWMDANVALKVPARQLVDDYLGEADIAVFKHRTRSCTYDEAERCRVLGADSAEIIDEQVRHYKNSGLPSRLGLAETSVVVRRNSEQIMRFNNAWWGEICRYSVRDQISFMFAVQEIGLKVHYILPTKYAHPYFDITNRPTGAERAEAKKP